MLHQDAQYKNLSGGINVCLKKQSLSVTVWYIIYIVIFCMNICTAIILTGCTYNYQNKLTMIVVHICQLMILDNVFTERLY